LVILFPFFVDIGGAAYLLLSRKLLKSKMKRNLWKSRRKGVVEKGKQRLSHSTMM
jgi:hypothetical protein